MAIKDANNEHIHEGDMVIYNLSGVLARGIVRRIVETYKPRPYLNSEYFTGFIDVEFTDGGRGTYVSGGTNHVSRIRNPRSMYVVRKASGKMLV